MNDLTARPISTESIQGVNNTKMGGNGFNPKDTKDVPDMQLIEPDFSGLKNPEIIVNHVQELRNRGKDVLEDGDSSELHFYNDSFKITPARSAEFFKLKGFMRITEEGNDTVTIIKNENKILTPFNYKTDTASFLRENIKHPEHRDTIEDEIVSKENVILKSWKLLKGKPLILNRDTKNCIHFSFKREVVGATADGVEYIDYKSDEIGFFMKTKSQDHDFKHFDINNRKIGDYEKFQTYGVINRESLDLTEEESKRVLARRTAIGYIVSNHKDPVESPAIIFSDEGADDESRRGGRGKSILLSQALSNVRIHNVRGGDEFRQGYTHNFGDLQKWHDYYLLDDVPAGFNYDGLYTAISGDITAERKGTQAVVIPFKDTPKFVITTNYAVRYDKEAISTNRRFVEYKISDFWNYERQPIHVFGKRFFIDWDFEEWQLFYEFLIVCAMDYLKHGLLRIEYSKDDDNYTAYFNSDIEEERFRAVFEYFNGRIEFKTIDFLNKYNEISGFGKKRYHEKNIRTPIEVFSKSNGLGWVYEKYPERIFVKTLEGKNEEDKNSTNSLPF